LLLLRILHDSRYWLRITIVCFGVTEILVARALKESSKWFGLCT
jgi:hypothetical protein